MEDGDVKPEEMLACIRAKGRDNARTPMQWDDTPNAGFTTGTPWIRVNPNYPSIHVAAQESDPNSVLNYYRALIRLRRENPVIVYGDYRLALPEDPQIFAYERRLDDTRLLVLCNFSGEAAGRLELSAMGWADAELLIANLPVSREDSFALRPYEARVYRLS